MSLNKLAEEIYNNSVNHGFHEDEEHLKNLIFTIYDDPKGEIEALEHSFFAQKIALAHSELSEAIESDRKNKYANIHGLTIQNTNQLTDVDFIEWFKLHVKDTTEDELADSLIRILELFKIKNADADLHVELKMRYNTLREYKHGGKKY